MKDRDGFVHLKGVVTLDANFGASTIFRLPAGHRPAHIETLITHSTATADRVGVIEIEPDGAVSQVGSHGSGATQSLDGIAFGAGG